MRRALTLLVFFAVSIVSKAQTMCGTAAENGAVTLTAPAGQVFKTIVFASYGTPNGTCGSFTLGSCNATNSTSIVSAALIGFNTGTIGADNGVFGDPCSGTPKRLYVEASYGIALPLTLISFSAQKGVGGDIKLQWHTADEINTAGFIIEKSTNGLAFDAIGTVAAKGKSSNDYDFTAVPAINPVTYYRLKMTDRDGRFTYSNSLRINNNTTEAAALAVFPNPAKDQITVSGLSGKGQIRMLDTRGRLFKLINTNAQTLTIDISKYAVGFYILQYITDQETISQKLVKQ